VPTDFASNTTLYGTSSEKAYGSRSIREWKCHKDQQSRK
jgi:hypothetical protein